MGTTAARLLLVAAVFVGAGSCVPAGTPAGPPGAPPEPLATSYEPEVRVGLATDVPALTVGGAGALMLTEPDGSLAAQVPAGEVWRVSPSGTGLGIVGPADMMVRSVEALVITAAAVGEPVRIGGRPYHGIVEVLRAATGITAVNRLPMERYLAGVVSAEMGRRSAVEHEALRAQAVVSRTYAMRNLGRWRTQGFDLQATVADQVYGGIASETPEGIAAVETTRGLALTANGAPIDAFLHSTCGGRTAEGSEVFRNAVRPYLRSVPDMDESGLSYCRISPRYRWREEWTGSALLATLRRTLPAVLAIPMERVRDVRDVRIVSRTGSGRVGQLAIALPTSEVQVPGPQVRYVLRMPAGEILRSNAFALTATTSGTGHRISRLVAEGGGAGHGVGFCQWGAVGRARVGHRYEQILAAYYNGTTLSRVY